MSSSESPSLRSQEYPGMGSGRRASLAGEEASTSSTNMSSERRGSAVSHTSRRSSIAFPSSSSRRPSGAGAPSLVAAALIETSRQNLRRQSAQDGVPANITELLEGSALSDDDEPASTSDGDALFSPSAPEASDSGFSSCAESSPFSPPRSQLGDAPAAGSSKASAVSTSAAAAENAHTASITSTWTLHPRDVALQFEGGANADGSSIFKPGARPAVGLRTKTMFEPRIVDKHNHNRALAEWTIPPQRNGRAPRAATFFLGKDVERWQQHLRDTGPDAEARPGGAPGGHLAWKRGFASAIQRGSVSDPENNELSEESEGEADSAPEESEGSEWAVSLNSSSGGNLSRRSSSRRNSRASRSRSGSWAPRVVQGPASRPGLEMTSNGSGPRAGRHSVSDGSDGLRGSQPGSQGGSPRDGIGGVPARRRRFSSNGPEAAFLRHETVIGLHTPRRDSFASASSSSGRVTPIDRVALAPLSQIKTAKLRSGSVAGLPKTSDDRSGFPGLEEAGAAAVLDSVPPSPRKTSHKPSHRKSAELLAAAAAGAAAATVAELTELPGETVTPSVDSEGPIVSPKRSSSYTSLLLPLAVSTAAKSGLPPPPSILTPGADGWVASPAVAGAASPALPGAAAPSTSPAGIKGSPALATPAVAPSPPPLRLAKRRKPITVDGTLYDRSGPFREGAMTDGLSVRLFSGIEEAPTASALKRGGAGAPLARSSDGNAHSEHSSASPHGQPMTYLITTPDNRVSSAAKLRRWAMDGEGKFYAAMEIKSVEAKMRAAEPGNAHTSRQLIKELKERYLGDLLDEVQKAETLNPGRRAVAKVLRTSDGKYVRLEEDYPEEAFFVIAGCEEQELAPVASLIFCQALRALAHWHAVGWMHGDVKLENLMFDERGELVVIDYENANPFRGVPGGDGRVGLVSYDWIPPEAFPGPHGRRVGPSADIWALGANLVRAFALRDGVDDHDIRDALLGKGQRAFLDFRRKRLLRRPSFSGSLPAALCNGNATNGADSRALPTAEDVDLGPVFALGDPDKPQPMQTDDDDGGIGNPAPGPSPPRLLHRFAKEAPDLLRLVIARCLTDLPEERGPEAEAEALRFADELEKERLARGDKSTLAIAKKAVRTAIELSGSAWVRPKLEEARKSLGL